MATEASTALVREIARVEKLNDPVLMIETVERLLPPSDDDSMYWLLLVTCWVSKGTQATQERYRALMRAKRRNRHKGMKKASRAAWRALPAQVLAYRAVAPGEDTDRALSWTLNPTRIAQLYPDRRIEARWFRREDITWYTDRRGEAELIILDASKGLPC